MLKRLNFTDRKRIPRSKVVIRATAPDSNQFTLDLPAEVVEDPGTQVVYIDVTSAGSSEVVRYRPTVSAGGIARGPFPLGKLDWRRAIFDVKVVEVSAGNPGRIVRRAAGIRAVGAGRNQGEDVSLQLLAVDRRPLGQRAWVLECRDPVTLILNDSLDMSDDDFCGHPAFIALVFPEICRRALEWAIVGEGRRVGEVSPGDTDAAGLWLRFALQEGPGDPPPEPPTTGWRSDNREELDSWIDDVVSRVCGKHRFLESLVGSSLEGIR